MNELIDDAVAATEAAVEVMEAKRKSNPPLVMSAFGRKADIPNRTANVWF